MESLKIDDNTRVIVMTGAGVSAESGVPTFRDSNGLWEGHRVEEVATPMGFMEDPQKVWKFYSQRREGVKKCEPNPGHFALAELEKRLGDRFLLVTQNVDNLHERAGSQRIAKIHGDLFRTKCSKHMTCPYGSDDDTEHHADIPACPVCGAHARPDIVWFHEALDPVVLNRFERFLARFNIDHKANDKLKLLYIAIGTSGQVWPAASFVYHTKTMGAKTILVNKERTEQVGEFDQFFAGNSGVILPELLAP